MAGRGVRPTRFNGDIFSFASGAWTRSQGQLNVTYFVAATSHVTECLKQPGRHTRTRPLGSPFDPGCGLTAGVKHIPWIGDYQALASTAGHPYAAWNDGGTGRLESLVERVPPASHP